MRARGDGARVRAMGMAERGLRVWATSECGDPHPLLSNDDNDAFRAVHDAFGHGATGCQSPTTLSICSCTSSFAAMIFHGSLPGV